MRLIFSSYLTVNVALAYCNGTPENYPGVFWPNGTVYSISEEIHGICVFGYNESPLGPPKAECAPGDSPAAGYATWTVHSGGCERMPFLALHNFTLLFAAGPFNN